MATKLTADQRTQTRNVQNESLGSYRAQTENESRSYGRSLDHYANDLARLDRKSATTQPHRASWLRRFLRLFAPAHRRKERKLINRLLREWDHEHTGHRVHETFVDPHTKPVAHVPHEFPDVEQTKAPGRPQKGVHPAIDRSIHLPDITAVRQAPVAVAVLCGVIALLSGIAVPGTLVSGILYSQSIVLPESSDGEDLLYRYIRPMSEQDALVNLEKIDTSKFEVLSLSDYVVQPGDTLSGISDRFNLNLDTIISFNGITDPKRIRVGTSYRLPNRNGLLHKVARGETLESISKKYNVTVTALLDGNGLADVAVEAGAALFIPDARMNSTDLKLLLGELFLWPATGRYTSSFGYRADPFTGMRSLHNGIDIAAYIGYPVKAALAGKVVAVESQVGNYGKMVIVQHDRGFKTLYAHLDSFNVQIGQYVSQGQVIARMGNTGRSTGPHVHFSVIHNGVFVNPMRYLK